MRAPRIPPPPTSAVNQFPAHASAPRRAGTGSWLGRRAVLSYDVVFLMRLPAPSAVNPDGPAIHDVGQRQRGQRRPRRGGRLRRAARRRPRPAPARRPPRRRRPVVGRRPRRAADAHPRRPLEGPPLAHLRRRGIPLHCHPGHHGVLAAVQPGLRRAARRRAGPPLRGGRRASNWPPACAAGRCRSGTTAGRRSASASRRPPDLFGRAAALGYAADLGCWDDRAGRRPGRRRPAGPGVQPRRRRWSTPAAGCRG